jgi:hypothetical protein
MAKVFTNPRSKQRSQQRGFAVSNCSEWVEDALNLNQPHSTLSKAGPSHSSHGVFALFANPIARMVSMPQGLSWPTISKTVYWLGQVSKLGQNLFSAATSFPLALDSCSEYRKAVGFEVRYKKREC